VISVEVVPVEAGGDIRRHRLEIARLEGIDLQHPPPLIIEPVLTTSAASVGHDHSESFIAYRAVVGLEPRVALSVDTRAREAVRGLVRESPLRDLDLLGGFG
jgi:hypothetical protein